MSARYDDHLSHEQCEGAVLLLGAWLSDGERIAKGYASADPEFAAWVREGGRLMLLGSARMKAGEVLVRRALWVGARPWLAGFLGGLLACAIGYAVFHPV